MVEGGAAAETIQTGKKGEMIIKILRYKILRKDYPYLKPYN